MSIAALTAALAHAMPPALRRAAGPVRPKFLGAEQPLAIGQDGQDSLVNHRTVLVPPPVPPVLQLAGLPMAIDVARYRNAFSSSNPNGDRRAARAFRDLVDPVPPFNRVYAPTPRSFEQTYGLVVGQAQVLQDGGFTQSMIEQARRHFALAAQSSLDGSAANSWRLVDASPADWWDLSQPGRFQPLAIDLGAGEAGDFTMLRGADSLSWRSGEQTVPLDPATRLRRLSLRCQAVMLTRDWADPTVFSLPGWRLAGMPAGLCSSGSARDNGGILPLISACVLIGCELTLGADWAAADRQRLAAIGSAPLSLGPFALDQRSGSEVASSGGLFLAGVVSALVPFSPPSA
jgi:hypothetical protein